MRRHITLRGQFPGAIVRDAKPAREGFSLIEVILATAILLGSVIVLGELATMGRRQSVRGRDLAEAQLLCEKTLNEVLIGLRPHEPLELEPLRPAATTMPLADSPFLSEDMPLGDAGPSDPFEADPLDVAEAADAVNLETGQPRWLHSIRIIPLEERPELAVLTVIVEQSPELVPKPVRFQLSRWIENPLMDGSQPTSEGNLPDIAGRNGIERFGGLAP